MKLGTLICLAGVALVAIVVLGIACTWALYHLPDGIRDSFWPYHSNVTLPFKDEIGQDIVITNNRSATDPTFDHLADFLRRDDTDRNCALVSDAIVRLHDDAEAQGIRAGVVEIKSAETESGIFSKYVNPVYACNVFKTTDRGIVYVVNVGPDDAPNADYILFYHQDYQYGTSYTAYCVPIANLTTVNVRWDRYPDSVSLSSEQLQDTGSVQWDFTINPNGVYYIW